MNVPPLRRILYERAAAQYARYAAGHEEIAQTLVAFASPYLPKENSRRLDVASGNGAVARAAYSADKSARFLCADAAFQMCRRNAFPSVACDMAALPFRNGAFDVLYCSMALHWAKDATGVLREMRRAAPFAALAVPVEGSLARLHEAIAKASPAMRVFRFPRESAVLNAAREAGWSVRAHETALRPIYFLSADDALRHLRGWGGNSPESGGKPAYLGREASLRLQKSFEDAGASQEAWRVLYLALESESFALRGKADGGNHGSDVLWQGEAHHEKT